MNARTPTPVSRCWGLAGSGVRGTRACGWKPETRHLPAIVTGEARERLQRSRDKIVPIEMALPELLKKDTAKKGGWRCFKMSNKYRVLQLLVALGGGLSSLAPGMSMGFSAVVLPQLRPPDPGTTSPPHHKASLHTNSTGTNASANVGKLTLTNDEAAWFMSVTMATTPFGCLLSGYLIDRCGRKGALIAVAIPGIAGWLLLATVPTLSSAPTTAVLVQMLLGRSLNGIAIGMSAAPACILTGETSAPSLRGAVLCVSSLAISAGILLVYFLGDIMSGWRMVAAFGCVLTGFVTLVTLTLPESPVWLRSRGRFGDADWVCAQLGLRAVDRGSSYCRWESNGGSKGVRIAGKKGLSKHLSGGLETLRLLLEPRTCRPLLILSVLFAFQQAAGVFVVTFNAVEVAAWSGIRGIVIDSNMTAILIGTCTFIVVAVVCIFIDRWGRRPAAILSGIGMAISMTVLATYVHFVVQIPPPNSSIHARFFGPFLTSNNSHPPFHFSAASRRSHFSRSTSPVVSREVFSSAEWHTWVPLAALLSWSASAALGFVPLPWALPAELLPVQTRGIGSGILTALAYIFGFAALRIFSAVLASIGLSTCLFVMAAFAAAGAAFVAAFLPETRGLAIDGLEEREANWKEAYSPLHRSSYNTEEESSDFNI